MNETLTFQGFINPETKHRVKWVKPQIKDLINFAVCEYKETKELRMPWSDKTLPRKHNFHTVQVAKVAYNEKTKEWEYHLDTLLGENNVYYIGLVTEKSLI
jgi:hypothetical protein